jgi:catechol 2,3-dioxygenase-like lactoylglutathione lyase family enzyme
MAEELVSVRYMVDDVDGAVAFYTEHFGFSLLSNARSPSPTSFAAGSVCS